MQAGRGRGQGGLEKLVPSGAIGFDKGIRNKSNNQALGRRGEGRRAPSFEKPSCSSATLPGGGCIFRGMTQVGELLSAASASVANPGDIAMGLRQLVSPSGAKQNKK